MNSSSDKVDARTLAHLLRANLITKLYIPPKETRKLRELLRGRYAWTTPRTRCKNRIHGLLAKRGYQAPVADLFGKEGRQWLQILELDEETGRLLERELKIIEALGPRAND